MSIPSEQGMARQDPQETQSQKKRRSILAAGTKAFLDAGYGAATMDDIATRANVSKQTIYHHFGSKEVLFAAIVEERCERFLAPIGRDGMASGELREALRKLGTAFLERVLTPESLALHRLIVAESARFPELGELSYESGPRRIVERLARLLETRATDSGLSIPDPGIAAEQFFGMLLGFLQLRAILCNDSETSAALIDRHVDYAVTAFVDAHRPR